MQGQKITEVKKLRIRNLLLEGFSIRRVSYLTGVNVRLVKVIRLELFG